MVFLGVYLGFWVCVFLIVMGNYTNGATAILGIFIFSAFVIYIVIAGLFSKSDPSNVDEDGAPERKENEKRKADISFGLRPGDESGYYDSEHDQYYFNNKYDNSY